MAKTTPRVPCPVCGEDCVPRWTVTQYPERATRDYPGCGVDVEITDAACEHEGKDHDRWTDREWQDFRETARTMVCDYLNHGGW